MKNKKKYTLKELAEGRDNTNRERIKRFLESTQGMNDRFSYHFGLKKEYVPLPKKTKSSLSNLRGRMLSEEKIVKYWHRFDERDTKRIINSEERYISFKKIKNTFPKSLDEAEIVKYWHRSDSSLTQEDIVYFWGKLDKISA